MDVSKIQIGENQYNVVDEDARRRITSLENNTVKNEELAQLESAIENEFEGVRTEVQSLDSEIETTKENVQTLDSEIETVKSGVQALDSEVETTKENVQTLNSEIQSVKGNMDLLRSEQWTFTLEDGTTITKQVVIK